MTVDREKQVIRKLLEKINSSGRVYLFKDIDSIARECGISTQDIIKIIQKAYLTSYCDFKFDLSRTRGKIKILALDKVHYDVNAINFITGSYNAADSPLATYILTQFHPNVELEDIKSIYEFYIDINNSIEDESDILYFAINKETNSVYTKTRFSVDEVDYILSIIKQYGYAYERDNILYWKSYSPETVVTEEEMIKAFTVVSNNTDNVLTEKEEVKTIIEEPKPIIKHENRNITLDTRTALNHIANELGVCITGNDSRETLEEMAATTNELIMSFSKLPDWEKLKSWEKFVQDWQAIMGDAINDRN